MKDLREFRDSRCPSPPRVVVHYDRFGPVQAAGMVREPILPTPALSVVPHLVSRRLSGTDESLMACRHVVAQPCGGSFRFVARALPSVQARLESSVPIRSEIVHETVHGGPGWFHKHMQTNELYACRCVRCGIRHSQVEAAWHVVAPFCDASSVRPRRRARAGPDRPGATGNRSGRLTRRGVQAPAFGASNTAVTSAANPSREP